MGNEGVRKMCYVIIINVRKYKSHLLYLHRPLLTQVLMFSERFGKQFLTKSSNVTVARAFMLAATVL